MIENNLKKAVKQRYFVQVCPNCGKTVHEKRRFCDCHMSLNRAKVRISEEPPEIGDCNFECEGLTCNDCPETCKVCAGFGFAISNIAGFGGKDCLYKSKMARCSCCQEQIEIVLDIEKEKFSDLSRSAAIKAGENVYFKMAELIRREMSKPVLDRINRQLEKAG
jgi:hypothetical protein